MNRIFVSLILLFVSCASAGSQELRIALTGDMRSSNPGVNRDANSDDVLTHVAESLLAYRSDFTVGPMAADSYTVSDDLTTYRFKLRKDLRFHNGEDVRAEHLRLNWEKVLDPATGFQCGNFYDGTMGPKIVSVEAPDDDTLIVRWDKPNSIFPEMLAYIQCPVAVLHPRSWDENGKWIAPIATGPYKFAEWQKGNYVLLERFDGYIPRAEPASGLTGAKNPIVEKIRWLTITDTLAQKAAVISGQIDLMYYVTPATAIEMRRNKRVNVLDSSGLARRLLMMQTSDPVLSDVRLRRAIAHALDLDAFAEIASYGLAPANPSVMPEVNPAYTDAHREWYQFDLDEAARLAAAAGYNGEVITIQTTKTLPELFDIAMIAEAMLTDAGFNIRVEVLEWGALIANYFDGTFQLLSFEYSPRITAFMSYNNAVGLKSQSPYIWENQKALTLIQSVIAEQDNAVKRSVYEQIQVLMREDVPSISLFYSPTTDITSKRVVGYQPWPAQKPRLWNVSIKAD